MSLRGRLAKMDLEELRQLNHLVIDEINQRLQDEGREVARDLSYGDRVYFEQDGARVDGVLRKIAIKNACVETEETRPDGKIEVKTWRVPTNLIHKVVKKNSHKPKRKKVPTKRREDLDDGEL